MCSGKPRSFQAEPMPLLPSEDEIMPMGRMTDLPAKRIHSETLMPNKSIHTTAATEPICGGATSWPRRVMQRRSA
jgi:hypothetical protein